MVNYYLTKKAVADLSNIWDYTYYEWSEKQADKYYQMLLENCVEISKNHSIGRNYNSIAEGLSGLRSGKHIIFYRIINAEMVEITRILHERMDIEKHLQA
jgi:toxin ParE1/3/4